jgi:hypothetical protein
MALGWGSSGLASFRAGLLMSSDAHLHGFRITCDKPIYRHLFSTDGIRVPSNSALRDRTNFNARLPSALLRRHREEGGRLLVQVFTAAFRALDLSFFIFCNGEDDFKWLLAIFAVVFVARHDDPRI